MHKLAIPLALVAAFLFFRFADFWFAGVIGLLLAMLAIGLGEAEIARLRAELDQHRAAQAPDREMPESPTSKAGDEFLQRLRESARPK